MEYDDDSDSDDFSGSDDDDDVPTITTTLIRSGRPSPTLSPYHRKNIDSNKNSNPFLSCGGKSCNGNDSCTATGGDYRLYGHKIIATDDLNRKRKKEISRRAQSRTNAVVIKTIYITTTTTTTSQSPSPTKGSPYVPRCTGYSSSKKRSKDTRARTRNLIGVGKRQLLSSRKLKQQQQQQPPGLFP